VLRSYAMSVRLFGTAPLTPDEESALLNIAELMDRQVTLVLPESEVDSFVRLIPAHRFNGRRLKGLVEQAMTSRGLEDQLILIGHDQVNDPVAAIRYAESNVGIHGVLVRKGTSVPYPIRKLRRLTLEQAWQELRSIRQSRELYDFETATSLDMFLGQFFWRDREVVVIDPYLGAKAHRGAEGLNSIQIVLTRILKLVLNSPLVKAPQRRLVIVTDAANTKKAGDKNGVSRPCDWAHSRIVGAAHEAIQAAGGKISKFEIEVRFAGGFSQRGIISSNRVWHVEHDIEDLCRAIRRADRPRSGPRGNELRVPMARLVDVDHARQIRRIATAPSANGVR